MSDKRLEKIEAISNYQDTVIVGGGIVGAGIFKELSAHNLKCLLIDKYDFSSQTSQASSKMLHGGIRYLENLDLELIKEALGEKNFWLKKAPHLCYADNFYLPVYNTSMRPLWMIKAGLALYDALSLFQNISHQVITKKKTIEKLSTIKTQGLKGSGIYSDAVMDDLKMSLECIYDAHLNPASESCNYMSLETLKKIDDYYELTLKCTLTEKTKVIHAKRVVFSTGPFTDQLLQKLGTFKWKPKLLPSKGSHLWVEKAKLNLDNPVVLTPEDGRVIFVIPQGHRVLVGTTESPCEPNFNIEPNPDEINYLLKNLNEFFPKAQIKKEDIISTISGIRPLVKDESGDLGKTARHHKIYQPEQNAFIIIGGKYTTFRIMAQDICKMVLKAAKVSYNSNLSEQAFRQPSVVLPWNECPPNTQKLSRILRFEHVQTLSDILERRVGRSNEETYKKWKEFLKSEQARVLLNQFSIRMDL